MKLNIEDYEDRTGSQLAQGVWVFCVAPGSILDCLPARKWQIGF